MFLLVSSVILSVSAVIILNSSIDINRVLYKQKKIISIGTKKKWLAIASLGPSCPHISQLLNFVPLIPNQMPVASALQITATNGYV